MCRFNAKNRIKRTKNKIWKTALFIVFNIIKSLPYYTYYYTLHLFCRILCPLSRPGNKRFATHK